jgi:hypothetical protein
MHRHRRPLALGGAQIALFGAPAPSHRQTPITTPISGDARGREALG